MWVPKYLGIIESDLSAVHRIDDMYSLSSHRFIGLVTRLVYYKASALRQVVEMEQSEKEEPTQPQTHKVSEKNVDKTFSDVRHNLEAAQLGLIESGTG